MNINSNPSFDSLSLLEWLLTNGIGGFASGSVSTANTRRYHGLLCASFNPPTERNVLVAKFEEKVISETETLDISSNQYPLAVYPDGYKNITSFERIPFPAWKFYGNAIGISKTIFMIYGRNATVVEYENISKVQFSIEINPFVVARDYHQLRKHDTGFSCTINNDVTGKIDCIPSNGNVPFYIFYNSGHFDEDQEWYKNFELALEKERGLEYTEDALCIGTLRVRLDPGEKTYITISTDMHLPDGGPASWKKYEELRLQSLIPAYTNSFLHDLVVAGDQFLVWRLSSKSHTIIAGYPWFTDWGRDTMIAMRGLIIATGKKQVAESIIMTFLQYLRNGLIPNRFPDHGEEPEYNTIDATLWLFVVLHDYFKHFADISFIDKMFPALTKIITAHYHGTDFNIHVTQEGLLFGGVPDTQLTWMDAKVDGHVVTPRQGCAVEINALWYNALMIYCDFGELLGRNVNYYRQSIKLTQTSFQTYFFSESGYLYDVVIPGKLKDDSIRPNQLYAISLPYTPLTEDQCKSVLDIVEKHLYTDYGLRSLSPAHPDFKAVFTGNQWQRDHAYHQGTIWSHLWGEFALAYLRVHQNSEGAKQFVKERSAVLRDHFYNKNCLHALSENFDGSHPGEGKGCMQQAWSIGMTLLALLAAED